MNSINLLPEDYVQRGSRRRANMLCGFLFLVSMSAVVAAAMASEDASNRTAKVNQQVEASYAEAARQIQQMQQLDAKKQSMLAKASSIGELMEKVPRSHLLGMLTNNLPESSCIFKVELDTKRVIAAAAVAGKGTKFDKAAAARAKASPAIVGMTVSGIARTDDDVAKILKSLYQSDLIADVGLVYTQEKVIEGIPLREFQIAMVLKSGADALVNMPEQVAAVTAGNAGPAHKSPSEEVQQ